MSLSLKEELIFIVGVLHALKVEIPEMKEITKIIEEEQ
jgi:hypothetical protein